jgi:hypothetical protein
MKEIKKNMNKLKDILSSWNGIIINVAKMFILPKKPTDAVHTPSKFQCLFFTELEKTVLNFA